MSTAILSKVSLTSFKPKAILALDESVRELKLGTIVGLANGIKKGKMPDGVTLYEGLAGQFEVHHFNVDGVPSEVQSAGVAYLPDGFMNPILTLLKDEVNGEGVVVREAVSSVRLAYNVAVIRADNPAGYSWKLTPLIEATANDPLAELRGLIAATPAQAAIAAPKAEAEKPAK